MDFGDSADALGLTVPIAVAVAADGRVTATSRSIGDNQRSQAAAQLLENLADHYLIGRFDQRQQPGQQQPGQQQPGQQQEDDYQLSELVFVSTADMSINVELNSRTPGGASFMLDRLAAFRVPPGELQDPAALLRRMLDSALPWQAQLMLLRMHKELEPLSHTLLALYASCAGYPDLQMTQTSTSFVKVGRLGWGWAGLGWGWAGAGLGWAGAGLGWAGLGWAGLGWGLPGWGLPGWGLAGWGLAGWGLAGWAEAWLGRGLAG